MEIMSETQFEALEGALKGDGARAAFDKLEEVLLAARKYPQLFEALLMRKRHALGLPLQGGDTFREIPEALQDEVEDYYVEVCRRIGSLYLADGDILSGWPYFRAIDEPALVASALEKWAPPGPEAESPVPGSAGASLDAIVDIALSQGANPRRGYELVLSQYGVCRAITILEHQFPHTGDVKETCGAMLVRRLHNDLVLSLAHDISRREGTSPPETDVKKLIESRPWLFENHGYHVDISHLQSVIRIAASLKDREALDRALQMTEYGRRLPRDFQQNDRAPFDDFYNDYRIFLQAMLGIGADGAVRYFTQKAERFQVDEEGKHFPGEVLVYLLDRLGRHGEAIAAHVKYLKDVRGPLSAAPSLLELSSRAGDYSRLLEVSKEKDDILLFAAGLLERDRARPAD